MSTKEYSFRVLWSEEDGGYIALCPEFEGVSAFGETAEEAMHELTNALEAVMGTYKEKGWELPKPDQLCEYSGQLRLRMAKTRHAKLSQRASDEGVSLNALLNDLISVGLGELDTVDRLQVELQALLRSKLSQPNFNRSSATSPFEPVGTNLLLRRDN